MSTWSMVGIRQPYSSPWKREEKKLGANHRLILNYILLNKREKKGIYFNQTRELKNEYAMRL
jgi:hypothetical protein